MSSAGSNQRPVTSVINTDLVVMGSNSKSASIWGEGHALNPLGRVSDDLVGIAQIWRSGASDDECSIIGGNSKLVSADSNGSRLLRIVVVSHGGGSSSLGIDSSVANSHSLNASSLVLVPEHNLVVISRGNWS